MPSWQVSGIDTNCAHFHVENQGNKLTCQYVYYRYGTAFGHNDPMLAEAQVTPNLTISWAKL